MSRELSTPETAAAQAAKTLARFLSTHSADQHYRTTFAHMSTALYLDEVRDAKDEGTPTVTAIRFGQLESLRQMAKLADRLNDWIAAESRTLWHKGHSAQDLAEQLDMDPAELDGIFQD